MKTLLRLSPILPFLFFITGISFQAFSQDFDFAYFVGGDSTDAMNDLVYDNSGNLIAGGYAQFTISDPYSVRDTNGFVSTFSNYGQRDGFVSKIDSNGNHQWSHAFGGAASMSNEEVLSVAVDDTGNVYVSGIFDGDSVLYSNSTAVLGRTKASGDNDIFLAKLTPSGSLVWMKNYGSVFEQRMDAITVDNNNNIIGVGAFADTLDLDTGAAYMGAYAGGDPQLFVVKLNTAGNFQWIRQSNGSFDAVGGDVIVDNANNYYITGNIGGSSTMNGTSLPGGASLLKMAPGGNITWHFEVGAGTDYGRALAWDGNKHVYWGGQYNGNKNFTPTITLTDVGDGDGFLAKFDTSGNFNWVVSLSSSSPDDVGGIYANGPNEIYTTGYYGTSQMEVLDSSGFIVTDFINSGGSDMFVWKCDSTFGSTGQFSAQGVGTSNERGMAMHGMNGKLAIGGSFSGDSVNLGPQGQAPWLGGLGGVESFIAQYQVGSPGGGSGPGSGATTYDITFQVDMSNDTVSSSGTFLNYLDSANNPVDSALQLLGSGVYGITLTLDSGRVLQYRYKNGQAFEMVPYQCNVEDNNGNYTRTYTALQDDTIPVNCFSSCGPCVTPPPCNVGAAGTISGPPGFCLGDQEVEFTVPPITGATSYHWFFMGAQQHEIGAGQRTPSVKINITDSSQVTLAVAGTDGSCYGDTATLTLNAPATQVAYNVNVINQPDCGEENGEVEITGLSGGAGYSFNWTNGETTQSVDSLGGGLYEVTVTANNGCATTRSVQLASSSAPSVSPNITQPSCHGASDGSINLGISGGIPPYDINWLRGDSTANISNVAAGGYYVEITDDSGCVAFQCIDVSDPAPIHISANVSHPTSCGLATGQVTANATGGTGFLNYMWDNGSTNQTRVAMSAGTYGLTVTDNNGCSKDTVFTLSDPNAPGIWLDSTRNSTCANNTGAAFIHLTNANNPQFNWSNGDTTEDITNVDDGLYTVTVTEGNCKATMSVYIEEDKPQPLEICMLTVDDTTNNNLVVFDKTAADNSVTSFNIYRESCNTNEFLHVGSVDRTDLSEFEDPNSNPNVKSWKYKISTVDACGNESQWSAFHKTIHMNLQGDTTTSIDLSWNPYIGFDYNKHYIERYTPSTGWTVLDSVSANQFTYTDPSPPQQTSELFYSISIEHPFGCTAYEDNKNYNSTRSNRSTGIPTPDQPTDTTDTSDTTTPGYGHVQENIRSFTLYPNPASNSLSYRVRALNQQQSVVRIISIEGRLLIQKPLQMTKGSNEGTIDVSTLSKGWYMVELTTTEGILRHPVIIQ